ncbi:CurL C-terminal domain-containing protein, partial [Nocardia tenerifensis]
EAPTDDAESVPVRRDITAVPWVLSARDEPALRAQATRLAARLTDDDSVLDVAYSLATRTAFAQRAVIVGGDLDERRHALSAFAAGEPPVGVHVGRAAETALAVVFSGQG